MSEAQLDTIEKQTARGAGLYRIIWKWHFLTSLVVLPFMTFMAVTGVINLFHDDLNDILYADALYVSPEGEALPWEDLAAAAQSETPGRIAEFHVSEDPSRAMVFEVETEAGRNIVWVNPYTADVQGSTIKDQMLLETIERLHMSFNAGLVGRYINEALTGWVIVMILTGLYLWWPRGTRSLADTVRLPSGVGRAWWRSTHMWLGGFGAVLIIPIAVSGLFWSPLWGDLFLKTQLSMKHFSPAIYYGGRPVDATSEMSVPAMPMNELLARAEQAGVMGDVTVRPAVAPVFSVLLRTSEATRHSDQVELHLDPRSGDVLRRATYEMYPNLAWFRSMMARLHVGSLWGGFSVALNLTAALLIIALSVTGFVAWWKRRPAGQLGIPVGPKNARLGYGLVALVAVLGAFYPAVGISLLAVLAADLILFRRVGWFQPAGS